MASRRVFAGCLLLVALVACSPDNKQMGLLLGADGQVEVLYVRCPDETVDDLRLRDGDSERLVWRIVDEDPSPSDPLAGPELLRFTVGEPAPGFETKVDLSAPLSEASSYAMSLEGRNQNGFPHINFLLRDLHQDTVYGLVDGSVAEFYERAAAECIPLPRVGILELAVRLAAFALILIGLATVGRWISDRQARRRRASPVK